PRCSPTGCRRSSPPAPRRSPTASTSPTSSILARQRDPGPPSTILTPAGADASTCACRRLCPLRQPQEDHLMERSQPSDLRGELKPYGMKAAFDEIMATAVKRQHEPQRIIGDLLTADEREADALKPRSASWRVPLPTEGTPAQAIPPIGMGLLYL